MCVYLIYLPLGEDLKETSDKPILSRGITVQNHFFPNALRSLKHLKTVLLSHASILKLNLKGRVSR